MTDLFNITSDDAFQEWPVQKRNLYYIPVLDANYDDIDKQDEVEEVVESLDDPEPKSHYSKKVPTVEKANLIGSLVDATGKHRPVLDIDFPIRAVESKTPGHYHLYLDGIELEWEQYQKLLEVLAEVGIIEEGYCNASIERGMTRVRVPPGFGTNVERNSNG